MHVLATAALKAVSECPFSYLEELNISSTGTINMIEKFVYKVLHNTTNVLSDCKKLAEFVVAVCEVL